MITSCAHEKFPTNIDPISLVFSRAYVMLFRVGHKNKQIKRTYLVKFDCNFANRNEYVGMQWDGVPIPWVSLHSGPNLGLL